MSQLIPVVEDLSRAISRLEFAPPVHHVYNPLEYARDCHHEYLRRYGHSPKEILLLGMNPGPWGMAQTGVPFGEVASVRDWLGICLPVLHPPNEHPKRIVQGFDCRRSEVSGARIWGWARTTFGTPDRFFERFFVVNYCPLLFLEESGRNRTPDQLPASERAPLIAACDEALRRTVDILKPRMTLGVGRFAESRLRTALVGFDVEIAGVPHPSPANPQANRGWEALMNARLAELGILTRLPAPGR